MFPQASVIRRELQHTGQLAAAAAHRTWVRRRVRILVWVASACMVVAGVAMLGVQIAQSNFIPVTQTISEYALGEVGWLFTVAAVCFGAGSLILSVTLALLHRPPDRVARILMGVWGVVLIVVGAVPTDAAADPPTLAGQIHNYASFVGMLAAPIAMLLLVRTATRDRRWHRIRIPVRWLAMGSLAFLVVFLAVRAGFDPTDWDADAPLGAFELLPVGANILLTFLLALWLRRTHRHIPVRA